MIERYSREVMRNIWTEQSKFQAWLDVEILIDEAWAQLGEIPMEDVEKIRKNATFTVDRIHEIEQETRHDVVAFTRCVSESLGEEKKWVHYGVTSTDVVDTAYGLRYKKANAILREDIDNFMEILKTNALKYKDTIMMGRTHGVHAEITTFGMVFALWYEEMKRNKERFEAAAADVEAGKISGAVGTFANIPPFVQDYVCEKLGIHSSAISTQILQRDRHAQDEGQQRNEHIANGGHFEHHAAILPDGGLIGQDIQPGQKHDDRDQKRGASAAGRGFQDHLLPDGLQSLIDFLAPEDFLHLFVNTAHR